MGGERSLILSPAPWNHRGSIARRSSASSWGMLAGNLALVAPPAESDREAVSPRGRARRSQTRRRRRRLESSKSGVAARQPSRRSAGSVVPAIAGLARWRAPGQTLWARSGSQPHDSTHFDDFRANESSKCSASARAIIATGSGGGPASVAQARRLGAGGRGGARLSS